MLISVIAGTTLGCAVKTFGFVLLLGELPISLLGLQFLLESIVLWFLPGPFLLSIPLSFGLVRKRRAGATNRKLAFFASSVGSLIGVGDYFITALLIDLRWTGTTRLHWPEPQLFLLCALGGLGLGLGCFLGLRRREAAP